MGEMLLAVTEAWIVPIFANNWMRLRAYSRHVVDDNSIIKCAYCLEFLSMINCTLITVCVLAIIAMPAHSTFVSICRPVTNLLLLVSLLVVPVTLVVEQMGAVTRALWLVHSRTAIFPRIKRK